MTKRGLEADLPANGCAIQSVLFAPFRPRSAHVVIFGPIFSDRPVPGWTEKRHHGADGAAQQGNKNGCHAGVDSNALSLSPAEAIVAHRVTSSGTIRPIIIVVDQIAMFLIAGKKVHHPDSPTSARAFSVPIESERRLDFSF
jgi:hypothetical protein